MKGRIGLGGTGRLDDFERSDSDGRVDGAERYEDEAAVVSSDRGLSVDDKKGWVSCVAAQWHKSVAIVKGRPV